MGVGERQGEDEGNSISGVCGSVHILKGSAKQKSTN